MKRFACITLLFCTLAAVSAWGAGRRAMDNIGQPVDQFFPTAFGTLSSTKASKTVSLTNALAVRFKTSAVASVTINGSGASWPTVANTPETIYVKPEVTSLVFGVTSTASTAKTKIYYQIQP